jgi:protein O-GlcNAc transferase
MQLMAELFECHDQNQFEIIAFSYDLAPSDAMRDRVKQCFTQFIDVCMLTDKQVAELSRELAIDIAIDLKGYTSGARTKIFSYRAAPIQVNYLGYPGTMGVPYIDYIIADPILIPEENRLFFSEKVAYLPNSYQVNDRRREISQYKPHRSGVGLPEEGFVFCCFNAGYKITPETFRSWAFILKSVDQSILWLLNDGGVSGVKNLKKMAIQNGVDPNRLIFAEPIPLPYHLARCQLADLFLDTLPCNAHTTASDALWAGLPIITLIGEGFSGRVAASLINAVGMPELITKNIKEYENLAIELATTSAKYNQIKSKLFNQRLTSPLFDTTNYTKDIEALFIKMIERYQNDLPPEHIHVA